MNEPDDAQQQVIELARGGDEAALATLFQMYRKKLKSMVEFRMDVNLRGRVDPSDVIQESYLELAKRLGEFRAKEDMSPFVWMRLVTMERMLNLHRRHVATQKRDARREFSIDHELGLDVTSITLAAGLLGKLSSASGRVVRDEQKAKLHQLLDQMSQDDQEIIALRMFEGVSNGEAAEILGQSPKATSKRFVRAISRLRSAMNVIPGLSELFSND
ncbi:sigma-70 family RNA polymerase sigma factor [Stieleria sp.]|uniref:sigma-70 family RNA polymerase sigma factor n=1 Tax=Stieleria sp. TaxID=2795976 RepID=UPI003569CCE4